MQEGRPKSPLSAMLPLLLMMMMVLIMFQFMSIIGPAVNFILAPAIGFNGKYPILTILLAALLMAGIGGIIRFFSTDLKHAAKSKQIMTAFNKEMREARMTHDMSKLKKLNKALPEIQEMQQEAAGGGGMKTMLLTMLPSFLIFIWLFWYFTGGVSYAYFDVPWASHVGLSDSFGTGICMFPAWLLVFFPMSLPLGALITKVFSLVGTSKWWESRHKK
jgi:uncharacterized membrane protein (DUF106 family)